jgi:hypothetical protein
MQGSTNRQTVVVWFSVLAVLGAGIWLGWLSRATAAGAAAPATPTTNLTDNVVLEDEEDGPKDINDVSSLRKFCALITQADKIVVRDGGFNCCGSVDQDKILVTITDAKEIKEFNARLQFVQECPYGECECCGYPGLDWYKGKKRLALTGVQHGVALRWQGFPGDASLTDASNRWLVRWMLDHGVKGTDNEFVDMTNAWASATAGK